MLIHVCVCVCACVCACACVQDTVQTMSIHHLQELKLQDYLSFSHEPEFSAEGVFNHELSNCFEALIGKLWAEQWRATLCVRMCVRVGVCNSSYSTCTQCMHTSINWPPLEAQETPVCSRTTYNYDPWLRYLHVRSIIQDSVHTAHVNIVACFIQIPTVTTVLSHAYIYNTLLHCEYLNWGDH